MAASWYTAYTHGLTSTGNRLEGRRWPLAGTGVPILLKMTWLFSLLWVSHKNCTKALRTRLVSLWRYEYQCNNYASYTIDCNHASSANMFENGCACTALIVREDFVLCERAYSYLKDLKPIGSDRSLISGNRGSNPGHTSLTFRR